MIGTLNPTIDYPLIAKSVDYVKEMTKMFQEKGCRIEIPIEHRYWEYGSAVELARSYRKEHSQQVIRVLNVGSGWDALSPTLATLLTMNVTECEPDEQCRIDRGMVNSVLDSINGNPIRVLSNTLEDLPLAEYDLVFCISVLEHVDNELPAWLSLAHRVADKGILFITVDCIPDPARKYEFDWMRKTNYTSTMLKERVQLIKTYGFKVIGEENYEYHGDFTHGYSFFRVGFERV